MEPLISVDELNGRMERFKGQMDKDQPEWEMVMIVSKVNQYYFTGTMQDALLIIPRDGEPILWVRRSPQRAADESRFKNIRGMNSYRDAAVAYPKLPKAIYIELEVMPNAMTQRIQKYFQNQSFQAADRQIAAVRAIKSEYELQCLRASGAIHQDVLTNVVPMLLTEGMTETDFSLELYTAMVKRGHQGLSRFSMFDTEMVFGQIGFGENSTYPSFFNGPGGHRGLSAAVPILGSRTRQLEKGDLVFVDIGCGVDGYHTDCTMTYVFQGKLPEKAVKQHELCCEIQKQVQAMLKPGSIPSKIYTEIIDGLDGEFKRNFMGAEGRQVSFLGHGIGLHIDELPVIAKGFNEPLQENMVFAVEPKAAIAGVGTVGVEDTFIVKPEGGECITGQGAGLMCVS